MWQQRNSVPRCISSLRRVWPAPDCIGRGSAITPSVTPSIVYKHIPKGMHSLTVFLVNNDHSNTGAKVTKAFDVK